MSFVLIPPGNFMMGSTAAENEQLLMNGRKQIRKDLFPAREAAIKATTPQRMVQITTPFYISVFETTVSDFLRVTKGIASTDRHPVASISWDDADAFCRKLSGQPKVRGDYRLPTSAEWEYACRAGTKGLFYFDPDLDKLHNHHARLLSRPPVVGSKDSNPWCVHDMYGSLGEWTSDWAWPGPQDKTNGADPRGPVDGEERVIRGCGWNNRLVSIQSVERATAMPDVTSSNVGFRVVLDVSSVKEMLGQQSTN
jgi:formylglycine-generating enzyme required for sulfatase activity